MIGRRLEPRRLVGIAVVVADAAVPIGAALRDQTDARKRGAIEAAGGLLGAAARAVSRDRRRRGSGGERQQARQQDRSGGGQRYVLCDVRSSVIRLKN
jgi:hypothetical protein